MDESRFSNKLFRFLKLIDKCSKLKIYQILNMLIIRSLMLVIIGFYLYVYVCATDKYSYLATIILPVAIIIDTLICCYFREGNERTVFSFSHFFLTVFVMIINWAIVNDKNNDLECHNTNITEPDSLKQCFSLPFNYCEIIEFFFAIYLFTMTFSHLFIPHTDSVQSTVHSTLITLHIAGAADVYDFFEYVNEEMVLHYVNPNVLMAAVLFACFQFCFALTVTKPVNVDRTGIYGFLDYLISTEAWAVILLFLIQDLPFLILRIIVIKNAGVFVNQRIFFFTIKNIFMIILSCYKVCICLIEYKENIKHYAYKNHESDNNKTLQWRTETEIIDGIGIKKQQDQ